ncbi:MAG: hypothetical protein K2Z81_26500, partial [Cyanobacteria bacterium]|nr:hypothetical protein [Cyanobacteriota bacterium]
RSRQPKFSSQEYFPDETLRKSFLDIFCPNPWGYIFKPFGEDGHWATAKSKTGQSWSLKPSEAFKAIACLHPRFFIGTRPANHTQFGLIDIDSGSQYHNKKSLTTILEILSNAGLERHTLYRSSDSGGWYIYIYFEEPVSTRQLRAGLVQLLMAHGFKVENGQLEVFPNLGADGGDGFGLRLPLQPGFAWLCPKTLEVLEEREYLSPSEALHKLILDVYDGNEYCHYRNFVDYVSRVKTNIESLHAKSSAAAAKIIPLRREGYRQDQESSDEAIATVIDIFGYVPPGMIVSRWVRGREFTQTGLTDSGQRHEASKNRHHYYFYGDPSLEIPALGYGYADEREMLVNSDMERLHNGRSNEINRGSRRPAEEVRKMAQWLPPSRRSQVNDVPAPVPKHHLSPLVLACANLKRSNVARQKLTQAVQSLLEKSIQISLTSLHAESGVAISTIRRHKDLWKPHQESQYQDLFAGLSGDLNCVVAESEPQKAHSSDNTSLEMPAGRLAARRIAYELGRRNARDRQLKLHLDLSPAKNSAEDTWREHILKLYPASIKESDSTYLQFLLATCGVARSTSPNFESQIWIESLISELKFELNGRWIAPDSFQVADVSDSVMTTDVLERRFESSA